MTRVAAGLAAVAQRMLEQQLQQQRQQQQVPTRVRVRQMQGQALLATALHYRKASKRPRSRKNIRSRKKTARLTMRQHWQSLSRDMAILRSVSAPANYRRRPPKSTRSPCRKR